MRLTTVRCALYPLTVYHDDKADSRRAAALFTTLLRDYASENLVYRWLLNFSHMTTGGYPQEVPTEYRIEGPFIDHFYRSDAVAVPNTEGLLFVDRAEELGVATLDAGKGVAVEDYNRDGFYDIVTGGTFDVLRYYQNDNGRRFVDRTADVGLADVTQPHIITAADYNNDGWVDLFAARPFHHFRLFKNVEGRSFEDVTFSSGLLSQNTLARNYVTWVSAWGDVDNDGDLDLVMTQYGQRSPVGIFDRPSVSSQFFRNDDGHFVNKTQQFGLYDTFNNQNFIGATLADYDGDDFPDLYVASTYSGTSTLFRNLGGQRFEQIEMAKENNPGFTAAFVDIDHDGDLDLFKAGASFARTSTEGAVFRKDLDELSTGYSTIFVQHEGKFEERRDLFAEQMPISTMGASYGDLNNDGCYDFYLGTGNPEGWFVLPNLMYLGERDGTQCTGAMRSISRLFGFGTIQKGHGIVFFDFDNDGDQDIYSSLGGMWPSDRWPNQLFVNDSTIDHAWVRLRLRGRQTNYYGVGARITIQARNDRGETIVRRHLISNKTGFGSAPYVAHVGLMDATKIESVSVRWPVSQQTRVYQPTLRSLSVLDEAEGEPH